MASRPELDLIDTFVTFVESENINEAARRLHISQPAVSVKLKRLEDQLGQQLFEFVGTKKVLGTFGRTLYDAVAPGLHGINDSLTQYAGGQSGVTLRIGGRREILYNLGSQMHFEGRLEFVPMATAVSLDALLKHDIDVAISHTIPKSPKIATRKLFTNTACAIVPKKLVSGDLESALRDTNFLSSQPYLAYKDPPPYFSEWAIACGDEWIKPNIKVLCSDWNVIVKMAGQGRGMTIAPSDYVTEDLLDLRKVQWWEIPTDHIPKQTFSFVYSKEIEPIVDTIKFDV